MIQEIKKVICQLSEEHPEKSDIIQIIDIPHIKDQIHRNALDVSTCQPLFNSIVQVVISIHLRGKIEDRKKDTLESWKKCSLELSESAGKDSGARAQAISNALDMILHRLHVCRVDAANAKLRAISPVIQQHGFVYSHRMWQQDFQNGMTLDKTKEWLLHTMDKMGSWKRVGGDMDAIMQKIDKAVTEYFAEQGFPLFHMPKLESRSIMGVMAQLQNTGKLDLSREYEDLVRFAIADLVAEYPNWGDQKRDPSRKKLHPEVMHLDLNRIKSFNSSFHTDVVSAIIINQVDTVSYG